MDLSSTINTPLAEPTPNAVLLYLFSVLMAISILCYVFIFYHFLRNPTLFHPLNNHVIILLLITYGIQTIFDTPLHLDYFRRGIYWPDSLPYCFILLILDYILYEIGALLMVWASIERHILIFNGTMLNTRFRRLIGHYLPLAFCVFYPTIYYTYFIVFYPCERYYDYSTASCMVTCFLWTSNTMAYYELIVDGFIPVCIIAIFSLALLIRVLWMKQQMGRQMTWKKNRKMTIQLLSISITFLVFNLGYFVIAIIQMVSDPNFDQYLMVWFLSINVCAPQLVFPFLCLGTLPNLKQKLRNLFRCAHERIAVGQAPPGALSTDHGVSNAKRLALILAPNRATGLFN